MTHHGVGGTENACLVMGALMLFNVKMFFKGIMKKMGVSNDTKPIIPQGEKAVHA